MMFFRPQIRDVSVGRYYWALIVFLIVFCAQNTGYAKDGKSPLRYGGWITYWDFQAGLWTVLSNPGAFSDVYFFVAVLSTQGDPIFYNSRLPIGDAVSQLKAKKIRTWLTVVNDVVETGSKGAVLKDPDTVHALLKNPARRQAHIRNLLKLVMAHGFEGLDIDYENLNHADRDSFSSFIKELKCALAQHDLALSVTVQPKTGEHSGQGSGAMDWPALCGTSDQLQIMLYNLHSAKTGPGPLASIDWICDVMTFAADQCNVGAIVPVLKTSGTQWLKNSVRDLSYEQIQRLTTTYAHRVKREPGGTPFLSLDRGEQLGTVFFEDRLSLRRKAEALRKLGFQRITLWRISPHGFTPDARDR